MIMISKRWYHTMFNTDLLKEYHKIIKDNYYNDITKIYCLYCVEESLKWLDSSDITSDNVKLEIASAIYDNWLDTDIQISKISDIICEHWEEYQKNNNFDVYDYIND